ncbi:MAG: methionyl-tRNA formyltransferase [Rhodospirillaceae bacterium]|jgi:methionyl-tRNA formyltransferase|nr:methionyl-tRNA formyltransferase [Rhodospirillaceae bacterium]MBT5081540.1 methionyl-tRNA formyltransferase [Rhodospirillaceae bacterium]MBT5526982.1 methionyl-tRNA formyltransferase [Rhodospirillaceae bacterium]MBT5881878.1 methionyl-tRNA formyltransferase [Rhodospirillaceae bacterium]MBT6587583.1 methionyl-tRNA formyltransferase [Rhodospirillaceae bacterium]
MTPYIIATIKPWNISVMEEKIQTLPGEWHLITEKDQLTVELINTINPRYVFFPHWSWIVPQGILETADCVCFHMTDVPFGRGGSPLQNLIARGHRETMISALQMTDVLDAGPVYMKTCLDLDGSAQEIFERAAVTISDMMGRIAAEEPSPVAQSGTVVEFARRRPEQSLLPETGSLRQLYDHIRMLDADTYPRGFIQHGDFRMEFSSSQLSGDTLNAQITIRNTSNSDDPNAT